MNLSFVSVIIPVLNSAKDLEICLLALNKQDYPKDRYEVIVIDNGSSDGIRDVIKKFPDVIFTYERKKSSYAARNKGLSLAKGDIIAFTDSDCIPSKTWIRKGYEVLNSSNCGLVGGRINLFYHPIKPNVCETLDMLIYFKQKNYIHNQKFAATANLFVLKSIIDKVGGFDPDLESGGDRIFGNKIFKAGYKLIYSDDLVVWHSARRTYKEFFKKELRITKGVYQSYKKRYFDFKTTFSYINRPNKNTFTYVLNRCKFKRFIFKIKILILMVLIKIINFLFFLYLKFKDIIYAKS